MNWKRDDIRTIWKLPEIYRAEPVMAELLEKLHEIIVKFVYLGEFVVKSLMFPLEKSSKLEFIREMFGESEIIIEKQLEFNC